MIVEFSLDREADDPQISGFDLGDIRIVVDGETYSSHGRRPSRSFMIYPSIVAFCDAMSDYVTSSSGGSSLFLQAVGSSLQIRLDKQCDTASNFSIFVDGEPLGTCSVVGFYSGIELAMARFCASYALPSSDPVAADLKDAFDELRGQIEAMGIPLSVPTSPRSIWR